ncbi:acyl-coenzyme A diphosphatase NUDT19-like [Asterias amurensis]|uniref:acyl-coenzyme A diphosphatase NUDT19-like n=1 Tax=Asterias amurensis TaxID=7602 RepID=UPI003AB36587
MKHWKEAATVILAASIRQNGRVKMPIAATSKIQPNQESPNVAPFDYKVLMLQRTHRSSFCAGAQVFPGGGIDEADFSPKWMELFAEAGIKTLADFGPMVNISQHSRPPMIASHRESPVPSDIAFRICAIRETFEESGVLLVKPFSHLTTTKAPSTVQFGQHKLLGTPEAANLKVSKEWRQRVHKNASAFLDLCRECKSLPDVWSLAEWSNWLTPSDLSKKRYDTMFYLCCMETLPAANMDNKEIIQSQWLTPSQSLTQFVEEEYFLPPPQVYELQRLCRFQTLSELFSFSQQRALLGCLQYLPVRMNCNDGVVSLLPGDSMYPKKPVFETIQGENIPALDESIQDNTDQNSNHLNRQTFALGSVPMCRSMSSITHPHGHCSPLPLDECIDSIKSKL